MKFNDRVQIGIEYGYYIRINNIIIPENLQKRRVIFIRWYFERYGSKPFSVLFKELASEVLYIEEFTLQSLIFNEK